MEEKKISIVIPVYNTESFLDNTIASILASSYRNLEVILIDNGSTDSSGEKCDLWASKDSRVVVKHLMPNVGVSNARNEGLKMCSGEYIAFVDSDDLVHPQMYELLMSRALQHNADMVILKQKDVDKSWKMPDISFELEKIPDHIISIDEAFHKVFHEAGNAIIPIWNKLYKASVIMDGGITFVPTGGEDFCFNCMILPLTNRIVYIDNEPGFYYYIVHSDGTYSRGFTAFRASILKVFFLVEKLTYEYGLIANRDAAISCYRNLFVYKYAAKKAGISSSIEQIIDEYYPEFKNRFSKRTDVNLTTKLFYKLCFYIPEIYLVVSKIKSKISK